MNDIPPLCPCNRLCVHLGWCSVEHLLDGDRMFKLQHPRCEAAMPLLSASRPLRCVPAVHSEHQQDHLSSHLARLRCLQVVHDYTIEHGAYPSPLHYHHFPKSVCTSVNEVVCHGIPDMRELESGDIVNVDVTCFLNGYHGDLNETFTVGEVDDKSKKLIKVGHALVRECC
jgi:hypothetical protein